MGGIDHELIGLCALGGELGKDAVEESQAAPADEPVVDRLVRAITSRRISPAQSVPDHKDDAAYDLTVIDPWNAMRQWEIGLNPAHLCLAQQPQLRHQQHLLDAVVASVRSPERTRFNGSCA